ncbi:MAG TPA: type II and III secretion system protein [Bacteroidota bacterium]|nr:type II and III secretion system protein [Bacteroidota bacterium]
MKKTSFVLLAFMIVCSSGFLQGQNKEARLRTKGYVNPQEIVSLDSTVRMDQALTVLNELSKQFAGKIIIDIEKHRQPIGVYIVNQHWRDALDLILTHNGLTSVEEQDYIRIMSSTASSTAEGHAPTTGNAEPPPTLDSRDVRISAVFFNTNLSKLQDYGISWDFYRANAKEPAMTFYNSSNMGRGDTTSPVPPSGGSSQSGPSLNTALALIQSPPQFTFANINALVKYFGSNKLGEVVTSPEVIVRGGHKGRIQVGQDIFISTRDIAGNTVNQLYSTGSIIEVTPMIYTQSDTDFVYLDLSIEQSDVAAGPAIDRTRVTTHALLYDGEETVIGGLVTTQNQETREGVPILKDLPGWFFGLRYLFGSESTVKTKNELIILLKAELIQPIRNRMGHKMTEDELMKQKRAEYQKEFEKK